MLRTALLRSARNRVAFLAAGTALAVGGTAFLHSPGSARSTGPLDLGGMMADVAHESATAASAAGSSDYFLKIEGIDGESLAKGHEKQIQVQAFSWGVTNSGSAAGTAGGAGAGKAHFSDFSFTKGLDKASPLIMQAVASGRRIATVTLYGVSAGGSPQQYLTITLTNVLLTSYQDAGSTGGGGATDSFSLNFAKIAFDYRPTDATGKLGTAVHGGWDVAANKPV